MKNIFTLSILFLFFNLSYAQKKYHKVNLNHNITSFSSDFICSEVIDKRLIKDNIGFVQKGMRNKNVLAQLDGEFETIIKNRVNKIVLAKENAEELILLIHELNISERTSMASEKALCRMEIEFIKQVDSVFYSLGTFSSELEQGGLDVTSKHGKGIMKCLTSCIIEFANSDWLDAELNVTIDLNESNHPYDYKITPKKGMYSSFSKLVKNEPMDYFDIRFLRIGDETEKIQRYKLEKANKKDRKKRVMFFSDGEDIYMHASRYCYRKHFIKAKHIGRYIYFEDRFSDKDAMANFGLVGGALSNKLRGIVLDTSNGQAFILTDLKLYAITKNHKEILQAYKKSKRRKKDKERALIELNRKYMGME